MSRDDETRLDIFRRSVLQGTAGLGTLGLVSGGAAGRGNPGGRPPSSPPPGGNGGGGGDGGGEPTATVTLITGQTVHIVEDGGRRQYYLPDEDAGAYDLYELDEGTYVIPHGADLDRLSPELFNVEFLIEQGVTDAETDSIPVIVELAGDVDAQAGASAMSTGGFSPSRVLSSVDAVAGGVAKEQGAMTTQQVLTADAVETVHLDVKYEALLDTSADAVNATAAREQYDVDGSGVSIAVLDTGIDADHPDFGDRVVHERDFSGDGVEDAYGHGTHCAGIAAGDGSESDGDYVGMAPGADLWNVKVLGDRGRGPTSEIVAGIEHAVDRGADVISMSLGGDAQENGPLVEAVNAAVEAGVVAAVAAGNDWNYQSVGSPGIAEKALTVGASDESGGIAGFSSGGPTPYDYRVKPEVAAPGVGITATGSQDAGEYPYTDKRGTSMATPHVAGIAALLLEDDPDRTPSDVKHSLVSTAAPLDGPDIYRQGSGVVDVSAALGADLRVHDPVTSLGLYEEATTDTATVVLENTGSEAVDVNVASSLENVQNGDSLSDRVDVSPATLTVAPGATETVEFTVETGDAFGFNSGTLSFETDGGESHNAIFGFVRGIEVTVEKIPHERSDGVARDGFHAYAHDGSFSTNSFSAFDASGEYTFVVLGDGGEFTLWSPGELADPDGGYFGEPTWTVAEVEVSQDNSQFTLDENETVPRVIDTSQVDEHGPFQIRRFDANLYANFEDGPGVNASTGYTGDYDIWTAHVTPVDESDPTNVATTYMMFSEEPDAEYTFDSPAVYHLFYGTLSVDGPTNVVEVDPAELGEERLGYHRTYEGQLLGVAPTMYPANLERFPTSTVIAFPTEISDERVEQTWYRNEQAVYDETWYDDGGFFGDYRLARADPLVPEAGRTTDESFNRGPLVDRLTTWDLEDGTLALRGQWYADQSEKPFVAYEHAYGSRSEWAVAIDGEVAGSGSTHHRRFSETEVSGVSAGSVIDVSLRGNVLAVTPRETTTATNYRVTYRPGATNTPPQVDGFDVTSLSLYNEMPAGPTVAFVDIAHEADTVDGFEVYYAPAGSVSGTPFESPDGWQQAEVVYRSGDVYGVLLDVTGHSGKLDLATTAVDSAGNSVETTTFDALTVAGGAEAAVSVDVKPNNLDVDSGQNVPVVLSDDGDVNVRDIDVDSLRFGDPEAVAAGGGAAPRRSHRVGRGGLMVHFRAADAGYPCTDGPVAAQLAGQLTDGTPISGVDVVPQVTCDDED